MQNKNQACPEKTFKIKYWYNENQACLEKTFLNGI